MKAGRDTIFAIGSGRVAAGISVIRVSGPAAWTAAAALTGIPLPEPRRAALRRFRTDEAGPIDRGLLLLFAPGASPTGEPVAEFHVHGALAVQAAMLHALGTLRGLRPAVAGEFTRRALENGRIDLAEAEGLADLLAAETEAQRRTAVRVAEGELSRRVASLRGDLLRALALVEAGIDFADEDLPAGIEDALRGTLATIGDRLAALLAGSAAAERLRSGYEVALVGAPNAGKSSLLNAIAGRDVALTSSRPGTTRDVIELRADLGGLPVTFLDMAGLRETTDEVEAEGIARARMRASAADLRLFLVAPGPGEAALGLAPVQGDLVVATKADLGAAADGMPVSALTGQGIAGLLDAVAERLRPRAAGAGLVARERQRAGLAAAQDAIARARALAAEDPMRPEVVAEDLRAAAQALAAVVGQVDVEAILGEIFASFCIGK